MCRGANFQNLGSNRDEPAGTWYAISIKAGATVRGKLFITMAIPLFVEVRSRYLVIRYPSLVIRVIVTL
jgi:hypothetical protein